MLCLPDYSALVALDPKLAATHHSQACRHVTASALVMKEAALPSELNLSVGYQARAETMFSNTSPSNSDMQQQHSSAAEPLITPLSSRRTTIRSWELSLSTHTRPFAVILRTHRLQHAACAADGLDITLHTAHATHSHQSC